MPNSPTTSWYNYTHALTRGLSPSFLDALMLHPPPVPIDIDRAHAQHSSYTQLLRELQLTVIEIEADANCPDCVFIEDTLLAVGSTLILTHPGAPERRPEIVPVKEAALKLLAPSTDQVPEVRTTGPCCPPPGRFEQLQVPAFLDGGDVMFDGSCLWVGLTARTNAAAVEQLRLALEKDGVTVAGLAVKDPSGATLHLKSLVSAIDSHHILAADNAAGHALVALAQANEQLTSSWTAAGVQLQVTLVPDQLCANVLRIGRHVVMQQGFPRSEAIIGALCEKLGLQLHTLDMSELAKADGALTCCSVLLRA